MNDTSNLSQVLILLSAAVLIVATFRVVRLSPVIGYLAAGAAIGPFGLKLITDTAATAGIAEIGVIFLLFLISLELSLERLRGMRKLMKFAFAMFWVWMFTRGHGHHAFGWW